MRCMGAGSWWAACPPTDEAGRGIFVASLALPRSYRGRGLQMVGSRCCRVLDESRAVSGVWVPVRNHRAYPAGSGEEDS